MGEDDDKPRIGRRLFASSLPPAGGQIQLDPAASAHARVLRLKEGDLLRLFDGRGHQAAATLLGFSGETAMCASEPRVRLSPERGRVVLIQCLPKASKLDVIVRMTTELGVSQVHLAKSERTVMQLTGQRAASRVERLERIAREAARQSGHEEVPEIVPPAPLLEVAERAFTGVGEVSRLVLVPGGPRMALTPEVDCVWMVVGPEGGLAARELESLYTMGFRPAQMTINTLRVETAAPVAVALALDRLSRGGPEAS